ncbi:MAG: T9SS sorting signal type C domain-containing protein, partial [Flavobacterium sp.]
YSWQRKKPKDSIFTTIPSAEKNTTYPSLREIKIENVGSAQYPHGTQFRVIVSNGSSSVTSDIATLTVNEITDLSGGTNVTQCYGTNYFYTVTTTYPENLVSFRWRKSVASGVWNEISDGGAYSGTNTATLKITGGTPAESGEYRVYVTFKSSGSDCNVSSTGKDRKITFLPLLTTPIIKLTQPACLIKTGTIAVAIQSATDVYSFNNGSTFQNSNEKSGLASGSYKVIIKNTAGCLSSMILCEIEKEVGDPSIWNGTTWLNGTPEISRGIVFEKNFNSEFDIEACSCQVKNAANVVINEGHTLAVTDAVNAVDGTLTFENNASLVQVNNDAVNSGNIIYKRTTTPVNRYDYTYWSSPVEGMTLHKLSPNTFFDKYYSYNNVWVISKNGVAIMMAGNGYIVRAPQTYATSGNPLSFTASFEGKPNNGAVSFSVAGNGSYLLGNPYPSAISADAFLEANSTVLEGTLYFWTHNTLPAAAQGTTSYKYTASDYATYNKTGGVATGIGKLANTGGLNPNGTIAAAQGFFASASAAGGTVKFNNTMRISGGILGKNNSQFFKIKKDFKTPILPAMEKNRIWLNLTNKEGVFKQMLVGYIAGATNDYDGGFDAISYNGNEFVDFYSIHQDLNLVIQGRTLPFAQKDSVTLGYTSKIEGEFQISIDHADGILDTQNVFLEDKDLKVLHNLKMEPYLFTTEKGTFNNRFVLRYLDSNVLNEDAQQLLNEEVVEENKAVIISVEDKKIKINAPTTIEKIVVYNAAGRKIFQKNKVNDSVLVISPLISSHQVALVDLVLSNGRKVSRKIIY